MSIRKKRYFTKRDQFKTKKYIYIRYQDPEKWKKDKEGFIKPKPEEYSCGEVYKPESWEKAEQKLREVFERKFQRALDKLNKEKGLYIREEK